MITNNEHRNDDYLDDDERDLMESLDRDEWVPVGNLPDAVAEARSIASATLRKDRRINVRISDRDLKGLKARAAEEGIPYQTLVTSVLHKYVSGRLTDKAAKSD